MGETDDMEGAGLLLHGEALSYLGGLCEAVEGGLGGRGQLRGAVVC